MKPKIIISVTSDLVTDQRVHKVALTLQDADYEVVLLGRRKKSSSALLPRTYKTKRFNLWFETGFLFYANYNFRLFFYLLFSKFDVFLSNDLDTLLPNFLVSKLRNKALVYDTHEYFTGVPELLHRPKIKRIWKNIEDYIFPKLTHIYTVNDSISNLYKKEYAVNIQVIRNLPLVVEHSKTEIPTPYLAKYEQLKNCKTQIILYQGAVNKDRGLEEMIAAMAYISDAIFVVIGSGDIENELLIQVEKQKLSNKVLFLGQIPFHILPAFTKLATMGISLEKDTNINYKYASPNKVVDYIHAEIPVFASQLIEIELIINKYQIGKCVKTHEPIEIAKFVNEILKDKNQLEIWKNNCQKAKLELNWNTEKEKLLQIFSNL